MNYFSILKLLWQARKPIEEITTEVKSMNTTVSGVPGWRTSEFWLSLAGQAAVLFGAVKGFIPPQYAAIITVVGTAVYTIARTVSKAVSDVQAAKATSTTVSTTAPVTTVTTPS
jgi:hypothetical protein